MFIGPVQPLLDGIKNSSVLLGHNLRDLGNVWAESLDQLLCMWGEGVHELSSVRIHLTLREWEREGESMCVLCVYMWEYVHVHACGRCAYMQWA